MSEEEKIKTTETIKIMMMGYDLAVEHYNKFGGFYGNKTRENTEINRTLPRRDKENE